MVNFNNIKNNKNIYLYAGDMPGNRRQHIPFIGLSLTLDNENSIKHDVTLPMDLLDNSVDIYQSEDVFEHIEYKKLLTTFNEIYRVLHP